MAAKTGVISLSLTLSRFAFSLCFSSYRCLSLSLLSADDIRWGKYFNCIIHTRIYTQVLMHRDSCYGVRKGLLKALRECRQSGLVRLTRIVLGSPKSPRKLWKEREGQASRDDEKLLFYWKGLNYIYIYNIHIHVTHTAQ